MAPTATNQPDRGLEKPPRKVRRSRQPRNPQLSVARRNERERNRVKMVNMGFALLREHLPVDELRNCESPGSGSEVGGKGAGSQATTRAGKKFSKVETLRAAIARIKVLEELIRQTEPHFESLQQHLAATGQSIGAAAAASCLSSPASSQDVKAQPSQLGYQDSAAHHQLHQQPVAPELEQTMPAMSGDEHTQLWLQQHQNSFMEQQQQHRYLQQQQNHNQIDWYAHQQQLELEQQQQQQQQQAQQAQKQGNWQFVHQQHSNNNDIHLQHQQVESPVWFSGASSSGSPQTPTAAAAGHHHHQMTQVHPHQHQHQHQQISLYSQ